MADNKKDQGKKDDNKIDGKDAGEIAYEAKKLNVTPAKIKEAIKAVGNSRAAVEKHLKK